MLFEPIHLLATGLVIAQCEPNVAESRYFREPAFPLGLLVAVAVGASTRSPVGVAACALLFAVGYAGGARLRGVARARGLIVAVLCLFVASLVVEPAIWSGGASITGDGAAGGAFVVIGALALRRLHRSGELFLNAVERRVVACAARHWYALDDDESAATAQRIAEYLGGADLLTRSGLKLAINLFQWSPVLSVARPMPFTALSRELQERHIVRIERGKLLPLRFALLSLRIVAGLLHYETREPALSANPACPPVAV
jgi:hypothetical protein